MARITKKKSARHRIEISMRPELHETYTSYKEKAKALGLEIDFRANFEKWFEGQLEQLGRELENHARLSATDQPGSLNRSQRLNSSQA
jgi:hypothetical protein